MMKRINIIGKLILVSLFVTTFSPSCTNLDEELYDVVIPEDFLKGEEQYVAYLGQAYTKLKDYGTGGHMQLSQGSADQGVYPTRGTDWNDGGVHRRRQMHTWTFEDTGGTWDLAFSGISDCNRLTESYLVLIEDGLIDVEVANRFIGELAGLRAFFYYLLIDAYGNVPIVTEFSTADPAPATKSRKEVFDFIIAQLDEWAPKLEVEVGGAAYGRVNYWTAKAIEAKMHLNAEVWSGTANWDGVIAACDEIINSGKFNLEANFFTNFDVENGVSKEFIFAIPYDKVFFKGFNLSFHTLHYGNRDTYNLTGNPWNGFCTMEEFYNSFDDKDLRKGEPGTLDGPATKRGTFLVGYQYKLNGELVIDDADGSKDPDGPPVNFMPNLSTIGPNTLRQEGARVGKWEFEIGGTDNMSNDFAVFRYADILLMKAEAIWRKTGNPADATALALVNQVRTTHGGNEIGLLTTLDGPISFKIEEGSVAGGELLNERGRELAFEMHRRQDLIRWGVFGEVAKWSPPTGVSDDKPFNSDPTRTIFAIPRNQLENNRNLIQNPGYTSAGAGG
ncbi:MAG: RagB/SusD family nutrient uptake outer membrane protein [Cyclobacteriaceae bacterium]|nr:RagB/SusD family nutrient uptake outer membrane protein [Cyclobacteriaceae bacterium]